MANTPTYGWPYQTATDRPDGPNLGEDLALAIEATMIAVSADIDASAAAILAVLAAAMDTSLIATSQATASAVYVDLATVGPTVTKTISATGKALVIVSCFMFNGSAGAVNYMGYSVSGATPTVAASDDRALILHSETVNGQGRMSMAHLETALTPGSNTFTAKYRVNAGTGNFSNRSLIVVAF